MKTLKSVLKELESLKTPDFLKALEALNRLCPTNLRTVGDFDSWLRVNVSSEAARAWRQYKDVESYLP